MVQKRFKCVEGVSHGAKLFCYIFSLRLIEMNFPIILRHVKNQRSKIKLFRYEANYSIQPFSLWVRKSKGRNYFPVDTKRKPINIGINKTTLNWYYILHLYTHPVHISDDLCVGYIQHSPKRDSELKTFWGQSMVHTDQFMLDKLCRIIIYAQFFLSKKVTL